MGITFGDRYSVLVAKISLFILCRLFIYLFVYLFGEEIVFGVHKILVNERLIIRICHNEQEIINVGYWLNEVVLRNTPSVVKKA